MSENSLQRYKARRAFQSLKEDKQMSNSEYVKLRSVIQNVKETRKDVVVVDSVVADPQNFVYVFILDDTFNDSTSRVTGTSDSHNENRYITDIKVVTGDAYTPVPPVPGKMSTYADGATLEDMIIKFDADILDKTNFYHYIKVHTDGVELSSVTTGTLATTIRGAIDASISASVSSDRDTIIKRVIVGHGTEEIKSAYSAAYTYNSGSAPTYNQYVTFVDGTLYDHIFNVDAVITSINDKAASYMGDYSSSNTIVLYPHNTEVSGAADDPPTYEYSGNASLYFRTLMTEQNNDKYTLLYTEWSAARVTSLSPSDAVYISVGDNTLTPATHYRLGANLAALE